MAREIVNRQVSIYIESGAAQKAYDKLIAKEKELNAELAKTTAPARMAKLKEQIQQLQEPISRAAKKVSGELEPSFQDLNSTVTKLRNNLKRMSESDADFEKTRTQLLAANKELDGQKNKIGILSKAWKSFWQEARTVAAGVIIGNTIQAALQTVAGYITGVVTGTARISDELSDIEKTTGLTTAEVKKLNSELGKIDTRTSRSELRKLAAEGGKLGFETADELLKFVDAADKIKVALKEDLGEDAILNIAKTSRIFGEEMLNMASAINEIGASSSASEAFSVDFIKRTGGVAATVKIAAADVLGYSSALEQAGQTTEVSATALNTFFLDFVASTEKFGKAAGFAKGELTNLIGTKGTNEGFLQFLERLREQEPTAAGFINKLKELGIDGARGSNVMLTLANNIGTVREQQLIANKAISSNASVMEEFNKKNNNAAANLDKLRKEIAGLFQSRTFLEAGEGFINMMRRLVVAFKSLPEFIRENRVALLTLIAGIVLLNKSYVAAGASTIYFKVQQVLLAASTKILTTVTAIQRAALIAYEIVVLAVTRRISAAAAAQLLWRTAITTGLGPIGVLLVTVGALAIALRNVFTYTKKLTAEQQLQRDLTSRITDATQDQITKTELYVKIAADEKRSLVERKKALDTLIAQSPEVLKGLTLQNLKTEEGTTIINNYVAALRKKAEAEIQYELFKEAKKKKAELFNTVRANQSNLANLTDTELQQVIDSELKQIGDKTGTSKLSIGDVRVDDILNVTKTISLLEQNLKGLAIAAAETEPPVNNLNGGIVETGDAAGETNTKLQDLLKDLEKLRTELRLSQLAPLDRELAELDIKYNALRKRAGNNYKLLFIIEQLEQESRLQLIQEYAKKEVDAWGKSEEGISKKSSEVFKKNLEALKKIQEKLYQGTDDEINRFGRNRLAGLELAAINASGKKKLDAQLKLLKEQERQELDAKELTENEKLKIEDKYRKLRAQAEVDFNVVKIQEIINLVSQGLDIFTTISDARTEKENAELEADRRRNDIKKNNLEKRLKAGTITQLEYQREIDRMDKDREKKEKEFQKRQFERNKSVAIAQALINGAQGVVSTFAARPGLADIFTLGTARAIQVAIIAAATGAQIAAISSQKPQFAKGGVLAGRYHSQGGNAIIDGTGRKIAEIEKDEGIINRFSMRDKRTYTVTGTPSQIASGINSLHGGVNWESGARLSPLWAMRKPSAMNFASINKYYAAGGKFSGNNSNNSDVSNNEILNSLVSSIDDMNLIINSMRQTLDNGIVSYSIISQNEKQQNRLDAIRADATMRP